MEADGIIVRYAIGGAVTSGRVDLHARSVAHKVDALMRCDRAGPFRAARTCVYRKLKSGRSDGEARRGSGVNG
jgi:hypothetical protein